MPPPTVGSVRHRVPILVAMVLGAGVCAFGVVAFRDVRRMATEAADGRLVNVAQQFVGMFTASLSRLSDSTRAVATDPALLAALRGRPDTGAIRAALGRLGPVGEAVRQVALLDTTGTPVALLDDAAGAPPSPVTPLGDTLSALGATPLYAYRDTVFFEMRAPVADRGRTVGWTAQVRVLRADSAAVRRLTELIGADASLLVGNADGSLWTDLVGLTQGPPATDGTLIYERERRRRRAASAAIAGSPLHLAVEFPEAEVLASTRPLFATFVALGAIVVAFGTAAGWLLSLRITRPILRLAGAADAIAAGELDSAHVDEGRDDEIGRLARSFNLMASSLREARDNLERQVEERTAELREAQAELVRKERLATLGQLSSGVGHELRNPLGVMTNAVYYLQHTLADAPPKAREYLGILDAQIRISEKIVADLLDFARIKDPATARVVVSELIDTQVARAGIPDTVRVERDIPAGLPAVMVDPVQVGQVLLNVVVNGVQAMSGDAGGALRMAARADGDVVRLTVTDTGPGVAPEDRERVFEPLFTTKARGIGLGLAVSRALVRANGGDLVVLDGTGSGAAFEIRLPAEPQR